MASPREPRLSVTHSSTAGSLIKHNREIAQVREDVVKMGKKLKDGQARNALLLEESSELDSEVNRQLERCLQSEQAMAEVEGRVTLEEEAQSAQEARHAAALATVREKLETTEQRLRVAESELREESLTAGLVAMESGGLRETLQQQDQSVADARRSREEYVSSQTRGSAGPLHAARQAAEAERQALDARCDAAKAEERTARQRVTELQTDLLGEGRLREERKSAAQEVDAKGSVNGSRLKELEAAVAAKGGDVSAILAEMRVASSKLEDSDAVVRQASKSSMRSIGDEVQRVRSSSIILRGDLEKVQEMKSGLNKGLATLQVEADEDSDIIQQKLEDARRDLQRSLRESANRNASEISHLESEVQSERRLMALEMLTEQDCAERIVELTSTRRDAQERSRIASETRQQQQATEAARCSVLSSEMASVRTEMSAAEERLKVSTHRFAEAAARRAKAEAEGGLRVAKAKRMIEDLWREIAARAEAHAGSSPVKQPLIVPGVTPRSPERF